MSAASSAASAKGARGLFDLTGRVAVITGGAGMLGMRHAEAIMEMGGTPVLMDRGAVAEAAAEKLSNQFGGTALGVAADITEPEATDRAVRTIMDRLGRIDILINNAALTAKGGGEMPGYFSPFEEYPLDMWERALKVNLTGAFIVTQRVGRVMMSQKRGVVVNIASDVGVISPDHRIYKGMTSGPDQRPFNTPIAYATTKAGLISFTRYLATYWAEYGIRVNALSPAGVYDNQDAGFVARLSQLIPLGRMAHVDEYKGAIIFLVSDASSFMTGANLIVDGGRTSW